MRLSFFILLFTMVACCSRLYSEEKMAEVQFPAVEMHFEKSRHKVEPFFLDVREVSRGEYEEFLKVSNQKRPFMQSGGANLPIRKIDWYDARLYCRFQGKRLPTYMEMVRASQGRLPRDYPFGQEFPGFRKAPFITHSHRPSGVSSVYSFKTLATGKGVLNLAGNVSEWLGDLPENNSRIQNKKQRMVYGGSYLDSLKGVKVGAFHLLNADENLREDIGFRCARSEINMARAASDALSLSPDVMQKILANPNRDPASIMREAARRRVGGLLEKVEKIDEAEEARMIRKASLHALKEREILVSEEKVGHTSAFTRIPYGYFYMGGDDIANASPRRLAYQDSFDIQKEPVTLEIYEKYLFKENIKPGYPPRSVQGRAKADLAYVSWSEAREYCQSRGLDLPTESQWEKAVRGLSTEDHVKVVEDKTRGYFQIYRVSVAISEWTRDGFYPYPDLKQEMRNYHKKGGFFKAVRGQGTLIDNDFAKIGTRRASMSFGRHAFRCVKDLGKDGEPDFEISPELNYFLPGFYLDTREAILEGKNPLNIKVDTGALEGEKKE